jgi:hypothetical protein
VAVTHGSPDGSVDIAAFSNERRNTHIAFHEQANSFGCWQNAAAAACLPQLPHLGLIALGLASASVRSKLEDRLARWLLMAHDRLEVDELSITHEFLSIMLGVRRPGVTVALNLLERRGLIKSHRGVTTIVDRNGLQRTSDGAYGAPEAEFDRLFG